jgi:hypothetical protein
LYFTIATPGFRKPSSLAFMISCSASEAGVVDGVVVRQLLDAAAQGVDPVARQGVAAEIGEAPRLVEDLLVAEVVEELDEAAA